MTKQQTKRLTWIGVALMAGLLVAGIARLRPRSVQPASPAEAGTSIQAARVAPANNAPVAVTPSVAATRPSAVVTPAAVTPVSGPDGQPGMLRIKAGAVLATVNGTPIELKDLLPLPPGKENAEQMLSAERYAFLLDRAVDREVTLQHARAQNIELTEGQRRQLAGLRARSEKPTANVFDDLHHNPANADFEARDAAALLLQASLAEKAGVPSRDVTEEQVQRYYEAHRADYAALPSDEVQRQAAWERINQDIRVKLARQAAESHAEAFEKFVEQLRASAQIVKAVPAL